MIYIEKIFNRTVDHVYLTAFEDLLELNQPENLELNPLQEKMHSRIKNYYRSLNYEWKVQTGDEFDINDPQFKEYIVEGYQYLQNQLAKYPIVFILWQMDEVAYMFALGENNYGY